MFELLYYAIALLFVLWYYESSRWDREGMNYHPFSDTSFANPTRQIAGNRWTENSVLKSMFKKTDKATLKFDNFDVARNFKFKLNPLKNLFQKKAEVYIDPLKLTETFILLSPTGGGKTVTMNSLLLQPWYQRALINDDKSGDFVSKHYNKRKDIIFCPFDERSHVWDLLSEDIEIVEFFIQNTINAASGGNQSFFTNDAKERYKQIARLTIDIKDRKKKWAFFISEIETMFKEVEEGDSKSAKDVISTMKQIIEMLKFIKFQLDCGKKSFTINDFFEKRYQTKLFMVNIEKYKTTLEPLFSAFTACFSMIHASREETKKDLTFYCLDEFLKLKMTLDAKEILFQKIRSKGGCLLCAMQYLPIEEKEFNLLTSSAYGYMIFSIKNEKTRRFLDSQVGEWEYIIRKTIDKKNQENTNKAHIIKWDETDKLKEDKQHIIYIPEQGALFVGKSDFIDKKIIHEPFILDRNKDDFYRKLNEEYLAKQQEKKETKSAAQTAATKSIKEKNENPIKEE